MAFCTKCGNGIRDGDEFCAKCGAAKGKAAVTDASPAVYRRASTFDVVGMTMLTFFLASGFAGCSLVFPPLLLITLPVVVAAPIAAFFMFRKAVKGPCPYCGKKAGPVYKPFNCRACRQRVIVNENGMSRLPSS